MKFDIQHSIILFLLFYISVSAQAQETTPLKDSNNRWETKFSAYMDLFYTYDFDEPPSDAQRQYFMVSYNRHGIAMVNHALARMEIKNGRFHGKIGLQAGTYVVDFWNMQGNTYDNIIPLIYEFNGGVTFGKKSTIRIEAGIFESHIGFERAGTDKNYALTRSIFSENARYFLSGIKTTFKSSIRKEWMLMIGYILDINAPRIAFPTALSTNFKYDYEGKFILNWSTFLGEVAPNYYKPVWRFFNNASAQYSFSKKFRTVLGVDLGIQQAKPEEVFYMGAWYGACLITQYQIAPRWYTALRGEVFFDPSQVIIKTPPDSWYSFEAAGASLNVDFQPLPYAKFRLEGRMFYSDQNMFTYKTDLDEPWITFGHPTHQNFAITGAIQIRLE